MDNLTPEQRRKNMQNIRSIGTLPELKVMRELKRRGFYFAPNVKTLPGKPDIVFRRKKVAVFIDSDFWHGHRTRFIMPKNNLSYWEQKIERNKKRDRQVNKELRKKGWKIVRIWEHDVKKRFEKSISRILSVLGEPKAS